MPLDVKVCLMFSVGFLLDFSGNEEYVTPKLCNKMGNATHYVNDKKTTTKRFSVATQYAPTLFSLLSNAEYVPTLTAAAALRVKAALSKAVW